MRVVLVDDHELVRDGLVGAFEAAGDIQVVGEASSVAEGLDLVKRLAPDVVVTDVRLPDGDGIGLTKQVRTFASSVGIVVLTVYTDDETMFAALQAGASGFVGKDAPSEELVAAARHSHVSPQSFTARDLAGAMRRRSVPSDGSTLSGAELRVLAFLVQGLAIGQVARRLGVPEATVAVRVQRVYEKLGVAGRSDAVTLALMLGLVDRWDRHDTTNN